MATNRKTGNLNLVTKAAAGLAMASLALAGTAACSSEEGAPATDSAETSAAEVGEDSGDAETTETSETIAVSHAYGETEVPLNPENSATLDGTWSNALGELGVDITMALTVSQLEDGGPWADYSAENTASYDTAAGENILANIEKIAPTVGVVGSGLVNDWREATLVAGQITGHESEAQAAIDEVDAQIEAVREAHPRLEGATGAFVQISPQGFAVVTDDTDPANEFLSDLGVTVPDEIKEAGQDGGRAFISEENIGIFNTDMLLSWPIGADPADTQGWNELEPVKTTRSLPQTSSPPTPSALLPFNPCRGRWSSWSQPCSDWTKYAANAAGVSKLWSRLPHER